MTATSYPNIELRCFMFMAFVSNHNAKVTEVVIPNHALLHYPIGSSMPSPGMAATVANSPPNTQSNVRLTANPRSN